MKKVCARRWTLSSWTPPPTAPFPNLSPSSGGIRTKIPSDSMESATSTECVVRNFLTAETGLGSGRRA